ncbi:MAG: hypothetical protein KDC53_19925 [Saprospiraceae bacterium]|nr:hypothetical protein [Saprospiraceae bacterium]
MQGLPIGRVNVILKKGELIKSFTSSDHRGAFQVTISEDRDSLTLHFTHLAYDPVEVPIDRNKAYYDVTLRPRTVQLPEISVKVPPVTRHGDTLTFSLESYVKESDQTLEEILARLPGITISPIGEIFYRQKSINKFYIEGLDLLEGRYRIATQNLNFKQVRDIQIIEHHQPIRALDSIYRPENAAINLKLKSDVALTGSTEGGLAHPLGGLITSQLFGFTKRYQFNVSGSFNNWGRNQISDFVSLYTLDQQTDAELISPHGPYVPPMTRFQSLSNNNREYTGVINFLQRLGDYTQLKIQGYGISDRLKQEGKTLKRYFFEDLVSVFNEDLYSSQKQRVWNGKTVLEYNHPGIYTRLSTEINIALNQSEVDNIVNGVEARDWLKKNSKEISTDLQVVVRGKNRKAYAINADFHYNVDDFNLDILDAVITRPGKGEESFPKLVQLASTKDLELQVYANFYYSDKHLSGKVEVRPGVAQNDIISSTNAPDTLIDSTFKNDYRSNRQSISIDQSWEYLLGQTKLMLRMPAMYEHISIANREVNISSGWHFLNYQPNLQYSWKYYRDNSLGIQFGYFKDVETFGDLFFDGFIVQSSRSIFSQTKEPNRYHGYQFGVNGAGFNPQTNIYYHGHLLYQRHSYDQIRNYSFDQTGTISEYVQRQNTSDSYLFDGYLKLPLLGKIECQLWTNYRWIYRDQLINSSATRFNSQQLSVKPELSIVYGHHSTVLSAEWITVWIRQLKQQNKQWRTGLSHFWQISTHWALDANYHLYLYGVKRSTNNWTHLLNLEWRYRLDRGKMNLKIGLINVLNTQKFISYFQSTYYQTLYTLQLRPRQLQVSLKIDF